METQPRSAMPLARYCYDRTDDYHHNVMFHGADAKEGSTHSGAVPLASPRVKGLSWGLPRDTRPQNLKPFISRSEPTDALLFSPAHHNKRGLEGRDKPWRQQLALPLLLQQHFTLSGWLRSRANHS
ncbi:unnamed protein product [Lota lota]